MIPTSQSAQSSSRIAELGALRCASSAGEDQTEQALLKSPFSRTIAVGFAPLIGGLAGTLTKGSTTSKINNLYRRLAALAAVFSGSNSNSPESRRKRSFCHKSQARTHCERLDFEPV